MENQDHHSWQELNIKIQATNIKDIEMPQLNDNETQLYTHLVKEIHLHKFSLYYSFSSFLLSLDKGIED